MSCCRRLLILAGIATTAALIYGVAVPLIEIAWQLHTKCPYCTNGL